MVHEANEKVIGRMEQEVDSLVMPPGQQAANMIETGSHGTRPVVPDAQPTVMILVIK